MLKLPSGILVNGSATSFLFGAFLLPEAITETHFFSCIKKAPVRVGLQLGWTLKNLATKPRDRGTL